MRLWDPHPRISCCPKDSQSGSWKYRAITGSAALKYRWAIQRPQSRHCLWLRLQSHHCTSSLPAKGRTLRQIFRRRHQTSGRLLKNKSGPQLGRRMNWSELGVCLDKPRQPLISRTSDTRSGTDSCKRCRWCWQFMSPTSAYRNTSDTVAA